MLNRNTGLINEKRNIIHTPYRIFYIMFLIFAFVLVFPSTSVFADGKNKLEITYHVYVNDKFVGKVDNENVVKQAIDEKVIIEQDNYEGMQLTIGEAVTLIEEKVFHPNDNNMEVTDFLKKGLTVKAQAVEVKVGKESMGYFNSKDEAEDMIKKYKLKYVHEDDLNSVKKKHRESLNKKESPKQNDLVQLSVGDSTIQEISLSEEVAMSEQKASPKDILNIDQGINLLEKGTLEEKKHKVNKGEVLGTIADQYDLPVKKLLSLNPSLTEDSILQIDQEINVTEYKPFAHVIVTEEERLEEKVAYETEVIETKDMYKGDEKVKQKGKEGKKEVQYRIKKRNGQVIEKKSIDEKITNKPINKVVVKGIKVNPSRGSGKLSWPTDGGYVSSNVGKRWGVMHKGTDIAGPNSRTITAADHGVVESAGWSNGGYGNKIVINHNNGMKTVYAHLASIDVQAGQLVEKGTKIGIMGSTGHSTGTHLHFEVYNNGKLQNPMDQF